MKATRTLQQRFARAASQADVSDAIQIARAEVRHMLAASSGIEILATVEVLVERLAGQAPPPPSHVLMAAVSVGIAIGQMYHPDVFVTGRAR